jgi:Cd2+/Zn2+-exporting ATPase
MHLLMAIAVAGAIGLGNLLEAAMVTVLFALAQVLESWSVGRARHAINALMDLSPSVARYWCPHDQQFEEKPPAEVRPGSTIAVYPGERIPLDGIVTKGESSVDQSPITGESRAVSKSPGDEVYAGSINNEAAIELKTTRPAEDSSIARIIRMVEEAQSRRAPSEQWVDAFARYYTPLMMLLALMVAGIPPLMTTMAWNESVYLALVLLLIACPCALVISTPVSIVAGLAAAARSGILIKGGVFLELPARLSAIAFDKTGTLTEGRPRLQHVMPLCGQTSSELLRIAAAIESHSQHPIARAVIRHAEDVDLDYPRARSHRILPGKGAEANIDGLDYWIGNHRLLLERCDAAEELQSQVLALEDGGHSVVVLGTAQQALGILSVADVAREGAAETVGELRRLGIRHQEMLTGDNDGTARELAAHCRLDAYRAELLPEDKVAAVGGLVRDFGAVAMVGDGVNDAPALAAATMGIAMGAAGSDAALETADVALMGDDLRSLPWLVRHSRQTLRIIQQNIVLALGLKVLVLLLAVLGWATLWLAILADMGASLLVIGNALRLLRAGRD